MGLNYPKPQSREGRTFWHGEKSLTFYEEEFESYYLASVKSDYDKKAQVWVSSGTTKEYLLKVHNSLIYEENLADFLLQAESKPKLLKRVEVELISKRYDQVLEKDTGCKHMFTHGLLEDLKLMYNCFRRDETTIPPMVKKMDPYILSRGDSIVKDEGNLKDPIQFTTKLLALKKEIDSMIEISFSNDMKF